jgi:hypothetical protein
LRACCADELAALLQENEVHLLHRKVRRDESGAAIVRIRMLRELRFVDGTGGRHGDVIAVDEGVKPLGGGTARGAEKLVKTMIERSALDAARVIDALHGGSFTRVDRFAGLIAKCEPDVPFADRRGGVALLLQQSRQRELSRCDQRRPARALKHRAAARHTKRHLSGHEAVARRCANRGRTVRIGEAHAFARELVDVRSRTFESAL